MLTEDLFLRDERGDATVGKVWAGPSLFPDWKHPNASQFWTAQVQNFLDELPVDGLWTDMNEVANFCDGRCLIDVQTELDAVSKNDEFCT